MSFVKDCADYDGVILMRLLVLLLELDRDAGFSNNGQIYTKYVITQHKKRGSSQKNCLQSWKINEEEKD